MKPTPLQLSRAHERAARLYRELARVCSGYRAGRRAHDYLQRADFHVEASRRAIADQHDGPPQLR